MSPPKGRVSTRQHYSLFLWRTQPHSSLLQFLSASGMNGHLQFFTLQAKPYFFYYFFFLCRNTTYHIKFAVDGCPAHLALALSCHVDATKCIWRGQGPRWVQPCIASWSGKMHTHTHTYILWWCFDSAGWKGWLLTWRVVFYLHTHTGGLDC